MERAVYDRGCSTQKDSVFILLTDTDGVQFIKFNRLETNSIFLRVIYLFLSTRILFFFSLFIKGV